MNTKLILERVLIMAILFLTIMQLGGAAVRADLNGREAGPGVEAYEEKLAEKCCRAIGMPHSTGEVYQHVLRLVR